MNVLVYREGLIVKLQALNVLQALTYNTKQKEDTKPIMCFCFCLCLICETFHRLKAHKTYFMYKLPSKMKVYLYVSLDFNIDHSPYKVG